MSGGWRLEAGGWRLGLLLLVASAVTTAADLPTAPAGEVALHGILGGERFWAHLTLAKAEYGSDRVLELVYAPPPAGQLGGAIMPDCPFLLVDQRLRLVAWNGRDSLARVVTRPTGYHVTRELEGRTAEGAPVPRPSEGDIAGPTGWDERVAPVLLAIAWRQGGRGEVPCYDLFAPAPVRSAVTWDGERVSIAGRACRALPDASGRLARLDDAAGKPVLTVTAWIQP